MQISSFLDFAQLAAWRDSLAADRRLVLTNGCFDILHVGHVRYLQQTRALGDILIVGLNSDASVKGLKGPGRPVNREMDRAEILAALSCVDYVTLFNEATADALIEALKPSVYAKAGDYSLENLPERETIERLGIEAVFVPFITGYSTTSTLGKLSG
jgi:rfaE bifunctional protein nucleotidyltransferase chain/domain